MRPVPNKTGLSLMARLALLPLGARAYVLCVLLLVAAPAALVVLAQLDADGRTLPGALGQHPLLLLLVAVALVLALTLAVERPTGPQPRLYVAQLRRRFLEVQHHHQTALARLTQEQQP